MNKYDVFLVNNDLDFFLSKAALLGFVGQETALPFFAGHALSVNVHSDIIDTNEALLAVEAVSLALNNSASITIFDGAVLNALITALADGPSRLASLADDFTVIIFHVVLALFNLVGSLASGDALEVVLAEDKVFITYVTEFLAKMSKRVSGFPDTV